MTIRKLAAFVLTTLLCLPAMAVEVISVAELAEHCTEPEQPDEYCIRYVQGFVDGAVATDVRVMLNVEAAEAKARAETLTERAMRTRVNDISTLQRAAGYAEFCLGEPVALAEVVERVAAALAGNRQSASDRRPARDLVYETLRKNYPCSAG